ncbi:MAG: leucyl aminopeptidase [Microbacterium sp.]|uniref:leucyl aminopeptidase n=1 Tax=Microbacterium sp. TaxID=51671 RepID=UPI000DB4600F|nr:leucyl aminopeptidase [Microbacterium sp.]PZU38157.1 MAG: leucyl aminopeptidase [Microbacterium sp.]
MPTPQLSHSTGSAPEIEADAQLLLLIPSPLDEKALEAWAGLFDALRAVEFAGAAGSFSRVPFDGATVAVAGVGPGRDAAAYRDAAGAGLRALGGVEAVVVNAPAAPSGAWRAIAEGAGLGAYTFASYKKDGGKRRASTVRVVSDDDVADDDVAAVQSVVDAVALVKDLVSTPADRLGPQDLADEAVTAVRDLPVEVTVLDEQDLADGGYGGILGVGRGSDRPPRLVRLDYSPATATRHVAVVGKGITFDTGGLSLKPAGSMVGMKYDMCGAAVALAVVRAAAQLRLPVRVTSFLCIADNMPSGRATRPGDVLTALDGTTIEVLNTDAEGRLVLADGLVAASREHPDLIVDVATLTGAITVALGTRHAGVMGEGEAVREYLEAATRAGELAWHLPLPAHMRDDLDSPIADLVNAKIGDPAGGSLFAGLFLQHFVGRVDDTADAARIPWVHLDIAGVGMNKGAPFGATDKGPTGATVRSLLALLEGERSR